VTGDVAPRQVFAAYDRGERADPPPRFCPSCGAELELDASGNRGECPDCAQVVYRNASPAVSMFVTDGERIVLCRRAPESFRGGTWCLPCGFVDYDEDFLTAARREAREETGLDVVVRSIVSVVSNFHHDDLHTLVIVLECESVGGELRAGDDVDAVMWLAPDDPIPPLAFEADDHIIRRWFATGIAGAPVEASG